MLIITGPTGIDDSVDRKSRRDSAAPGRAARDIIRGDTAARGSEISTTVSDQSRKNSSDNFRKILIQDKLKHVINLFLILNNSSYIISL